MPAYVDRRILEFMNSSSEELTASLHSAYASDGFISQYTTQTVAWEISIPKIKAGLRRLLEQYPDAGNWSVILELPLYRLRKRIDLMIVSRQAIAVIELKVGETQFNSADFHQVEEYALDLRDFHETSQGVPILPVLWCTEATHQTLYLQPLQSGVTEVITVGKEGLGQFLIDLAQVVKSAPSVVSDKWASGAYMPVPSVIEAATSLFSGHGVQEIAQADAVNLDVAAKCVSRLIEQAKEKNENYLVLLTGVPGAGKTLAGLQVVHNFEGTAGRKHGDVVYLSGNTPLVTVLREALTEDEYFRKKTTGEKVNKKGIRSGVRSRIQHIMDFLREYLTDLENRPPYEHAIVFDEAQRAWDAAYGKQKFGRSDSEPTLLLEIMGRHDSWAVIVGLIGGGQEINSGENGMAEWGESLRSLPLSKKVKWKVIGPPGMNGGGKGSAYIGLGDLQGIKTEVFSELELTVPLRCFRSPLVAEWVAAVLDGQKNQARSIMDDIKEYPIYLTRSVECAKKWLRSQGRGQRRFGLVASSTASRLRAEGYGVTVNATDGTKIANWYLAPRNDVRSSFFMEVLANEYTTQGLELDFVGLCWGGDLTREHGQWLTRRFSGNSWNNAKGERRRFIINSYRVLLTRAREGMVIWVPQGNPKDKTRLPKFYDQTATFLLNCGVQAIEP